MYYSHDYYYFIALTPGGSNLTFTPTFHPLLRAGPATTPVLTPGGVSIGAVRSSSTVSSNGTPKFGSLTTTPLSLCSTSSVVGIGGEEGKPSPVTLIPNTVQTLVSQIQNAQVHHHHHGSSVGGVTVAAPPSQAAAQVISTTPSSHLQSSPHLALPLAIALPGGSASGEWNLNICSTM